MKRLASSSTSVDLSESTFAGSLLTIESLGHPWVRLDKFGPDLPSWTAPWVLASTCGRTRDPPA
jgi:hypothetical protein